MKQKAQEEIEKMNEDGNVLVDEYKGLSDQSNNPALHCRRQGQVAKRSAEEARRDSAQEERNQHLCPKHPAFAPAAPPDLPQLDARRNRQDRHGRCQA